MNNDEAERLADAIWTVLLKRAAFCCAMNSLSGDEQLAIEQEVLEVIREN